MRYMLAVDGGGTKTQTILFQEDGHILFQKKGKGTNPLDIGVEEARKRILDLIIEAASNCPGKLSSVYAGVAGMVYFDSFFDFDLREKLNTESFVIETDGRNLISSELYHNEDGCCLIVGTGCGTWLRISSYSEIFHIGGWGYLVDTLGSGYSLGREAVRAVCLANDGRGEKTVLTELLEKETNTSLLHCIPELYAGGRSRFASLAHIVFEGKASNDPVSVNIIDTGASRLSELIWAADRYFDSEYPVVAGGGIVTAYPDYYNLIRSKCPERAKLILATAPPIFGAAVEAMRQAKIRLPGDFRTNFLNDLESNGENNAKA